MLYASSELIQKVGMENLRELDIDWLKYIASNDEYIEYEGMLLTKDDMYNLYVSLSEQDECYEEVF